MKIDCHLVLLLVSYVSKVAAMTGQVIKKDRVDIPAYLTLFLSVVNRAVNRPMECAAFCTAEPACLLIVYLTANKNCARVQRVPVSTNPVQTADRPQSEYTASNTVKLWAVTDYDKQIADMTSLRKKQQILIQQRIDDSQSFNRTWIEYQNGFGNPNNNFWIGLETLHMLTSGPNKATLRFEMMKLGSEVVFWAEYNDFSVGNSDSKYTLHLKEFNTSSSAGDSMIGTISWGILDGMKFSTWDQDNDAGASYSCSIAHGHVGWWFNYCSSCNPNGIVFSTSTNDPKGVFWKTLNNWNSLKMCKIWVIV